MIDRLRELLRAATPGPWSGDEDGHVYPESRPVTSEVRARGIIVDVFGGRHAADAALIVELRNHAAELLDAHDRMAGALREIAEQCEMAIDEIDRLDLMTDGAKALREASRRIAGQCRAALAVPKEENPE